MEFKRSRRLEKSIIPAMLFFLVRCLLLQNLLVFTTSALVNNSSKLSGRDLVDYVNTVQNLFTAEYHERTFGAMDSKYLDPSVNKQFPIRTAISTQIPAHFDARDVWPQCSSLKLIRDQALCLSCWAFTTAEIISDRTCIKSNGTQQPIISPQDIVSCCGSQCGYGCEGGWPIQALKWWNTNGVVTGGDYQGAGCKPYTIPACTKAPCVEKPTPQCSKSCQSGYETKYTQDKHYGTSAYTIANNVAAIQTEILLHGPVVAAIKFYEDLQYVKTGIYSHVYGKEVGGHAVKIIGWGTEKNVDYWIMANSWNTKWGDGGFFKMKRGSNECGVESGVVAGEPRVSGAEGKMGMVAVLVLMIAFVK